MTRSKAQIDADARKARHLEAIEAGERAEQRWHPEDVWGARTWSPVTLVVLRAITILIVLSIVVVLGSWWFSLLAGIVLGLILDRLLELA